MKMIRFAAALTIMVGSLLLIGCGSWGDARFRETRTLSQAHVPSMPIAVRTSNGAIQVEQTLVTDEVIITAHIKARTQERLDAVEIIANRDASGALSVFAEWPDRRLNSEGCSFEILIPDADGVELKTSNGAVTITGLAGYALLDTSNGRITVRDHDGDVHASTSNGRIELEHITGSANLDTSNGAIVASDITGEIDADTSNGAVRLTLSDLNAGPVRADTSNGAITLTVGENFAGELRVRTSNGSIRVGDGAHEYVRETSKHAVRFDFGPGDRDSDISTSNGSVTISMAPPASMYED